MSVTTVECRQCGTRMAAEGVRLLDRTDQISAMGYSGLIPQLPRTLQTVLRTGRGTREPLPDLVIAVDVWQPLRALRVALPHDDEAVRVAIRQRLEDHGVGDAEDRGGRPDGDAEGEDRRGRERRGACQQPDGVAEVGDEG